MNGIYIHVPYCRQKCHYCNFFSVASGRHRGEFVHSLIGETGLLKGYLGEGPIESIYLGGGTPSLLNGEELNRIFEALNTHFKIQEDAEITLEANPDDLDAAFLIQLKNTPVNRLSIGIQSFRDKDLAYLNRVHSAEQALRAIRLSRDHGFPDMSIDLIYGIPTLTDDDWQYNLDTFVSLGIPHLSAYALTVEPKTALDVLIRQGKMQPVEEEKAATQFRQLMDFMKRTGYTHYEISNFCREEGYAVHNTNYWLGGKYLGLGPSAHSYNGESRQWNPAQLSRYMKGIADGSPVFEKEELSGIQKYNEYVMLSLRTIWGVDVDRIERKFGEEYQAFFLEEVKKFIARGQVVIKDNTAVLSEKGKLFADGIAAELFWPE